MTTVLYGINTSSAETLAVRIRPQKTTKIPLEVGVHFRQHYSGSHGDDAMKVKVSQSLDVTQKVPI